MHPLGGILGTVQRECTELFCGQLNTAEQHSPPGCYVRLYEQSDMEKTGT